jgi:hypothetical protein
MLIIFYIISNTETPAIIDRSKKPSFFSTTNINDVKPIDSVNITHTIILLYFKEKLY